MRHTWAKIRGINLVRETEDHDESHRVTDVKKCARCELLRGTCKTFSNFPILVYFRNDIIESFERIPYKCMEARVVGERKKRKKRKKKKTLKQELMFTEEEFLL